MPDTTPTPGWRAPDWKTTVRARLAPLQLTASAEAVLADEMVQHLDDLYRDLILDRVPESEALARAVAELDDLGPLQADVQASQRLPRVEPVPVADALHARIGTDVWRDLRYAARSLSRAPLFTLFVIITLGLGIGANTTVFTLIDTLLLHPLPVEQPSTLVAIGVENTTAGGAQQSSPMMPVAYADYVDYQAGARTFASAAAYTRLRVLTWQQSSAAMQSLFTEFVTPNYFSTLGVRMAAGRPLAPAIDGRPGTPAVAVMNYGTWQNRFGGAPDIIGRQLHINTLVVTIVGVAPPGFIGVNPIVGPDLWMPASFAEPMLPIEMRSLFTDRRKAVFSIVARLKPDAGVAHAQANIGTVSAALARAYPETNESRRAIVRPIGDVLLGSNRLVMFAGVVLAAVVGVVLLIACSNVANLLLARSAVRRHEMAVRVALGASRGRLVRQLLTESLCLALLSGVAGLALGIGAMRLLHGTLPATGLLVSSMPSSRVLLFALAVSVITGIVFGIVPAMRASRDGLADVLRETRTAGPSGRRVSVANALLVGQVALSFVLLVTSGLFLRSLQHAYALDPGFQADRLALFIANPGQAGYTEVQTRQFYRDVRARVVTMPGVASVSWSANQLLFAPPVTGLQVEGRPSRARGEMPTTIVNTVDRDYFETAGVALLRGRDFTTNDGPDALRVAIVNDKLARDYWPGEEAIGKRLQVPGETVMRTVIGVARVANYSTWAEPPQRCVYVPLEQTSAETMTLFVRTTGDPAAVLVPIEKEVHVLAPRVLLTWNRTGRAIVDGGLFQARMGVTLLGVFGVLALGLACIGLYGNLAYLVQQRRREIGVRMALGASRGGVLRLILARGVSLVLVGIALGVAAALGAGRLLARLLYGVSSGDPVSLTGAAGALLAVALLACLLPAWRATRVDPLIALRE